MPEPTAGRRPSGELEASVLAALWAAGGRALTPADVQRELGRELARTTVTTILARLHEKGTVSRRRSGRGYAYLPVQDSPGLAARRMRSELDKSGQDARGTVLARFVSELGPDDERLLRELLVDGGPTDRSPDDPRDPTPMTGPGHAPVTGLDHSPDGARAVGLDHSPDDAPDGNGVPGSREPGGGPAR